MSDNRRRFRAIFKALKQFFPTEPKGNVARRLNVLAGLMSGIVGSKRTNLPSIASKVPSGAKREGRIKRFSRFLANERIETETYFSPFSRVLLEGLAHRTLVLVIDASEVGRHCMTLMVSVIYKKRALPIAFVVTTGSKGHLPQETHVQLVKQVETIVPPDSDVVFLGDGEFDGTILQQTLDSYGWSYVCRTAKNTQLNEDGNWFAFSDIGVQPGNCIGLEQVSFTEQAYGPVLAVAWWAADYKQPIYLVSNLDLVDEACYWYTRRFCIETFFSD